jgi:hypothetical protein
VRGAVSGDDVRRERALSAPHANAIVIENRMTYEGGINLFTAGEPMKHSIALWLGFVIVSSAAAVACSSSDSGGGGAAGSAGSAGTAGSGGSAGAGGSGGSGGAGGSGGSSGGCEFPQCFTDLMAGCNFTGACTQSTSTSGGGIVANVCYADGGKLTTSSSASGTQATGYKSGGSVCFTADTTYDSTNATATYKDPNGATVATVTTPLAGGATTIQCGGQTYTIDPSQCADGGSGGAGGSSCTQGTCTVP